MDASRERNHQNSAGSFVSVSPIARYDHDGPAALLRRISEYLHPPDFSSQCCTRYRHLLSRELCLGESPPVFFPFDVSFIKRTVVIRDQIILVFAVSLSLAFPDNLLKC